MASLAINWPTLLGPPVPVHVQTSRHIPAIAIDDDTSAALCQPRAQIRAAYSCSPMQVSDSVLQITRALASGLGAVSAPSRRAGSHRKTEMDWLQANPELFAPHRGQWVVVEGERIVAASPEYAEARASALKQGVEVPFIFFIPEDDLPFMGV